MNNILRLVIGIVGIASTMIALAIKAYPLFVPVALVGIGIVIAQMAAFRLLGTPAVKTETPVRHRVRRQTVADNIIAFDPGLANPPAPLGEIIPFEVPKPRPSLFDVCFENRTPDGAPVQTIKAEALSTDEVIRGLAPTPVIVSRMELEQIAEEGKPLTREFDAPKAVFTRRGRRIDRPNWYKNRITIPPCLS